MTTSSTSTSSTSILPSSQTTGIQLPSTAQSSIERPTSMDHIPSELRNFFVLNSKDYRTVFHLSVMDKHWHKLLQEDNSSLWKSLLERDFKLPIPDLKQDLPPDAKSYKTAYKIYCLRIQNYINNFFIPHSRRDNSLIELEPFLWPQALYQASLIPDDLMSVKIEVIQDLFSKCQQDRSHDTCFFSKYDLGPKVALSCPATDSKSLDLGKIAEEAMKNGHDCYHTNNNVKSLTTYYTTYYNHFMKAAERIALQIPSSYIKNKVLKKLALTYIAEGFLEQAERIAAELINDKFFKKDVLEDISQAYLKDHMKINAERVAGRNEDIVTKSEALRHLVQTYIKAGYNGPSMLSDAERVAKEIPETKIKDMALKELFRAYLHEDSSEAKRVASLMTNESIKKKAFEEIAIEQDLKENIAIENDSKKGEALYAIVQRFIKLGNLGRATEVTSLIPNIPNVPNDDKRPNAFKTISSLYLSELNYKEAEKVALLISDPKKRSLALKDICKFHQNLHEEVEATRIALSIPDDQIKSQILKEIFLLNLDKKDFDAAISLIRIIPHSIQNIRIKNITLRELFHAFFRKFAALKEKEKKEYLQNQIFFGQNNFNMITDDRLKALCLKERSEFYLQENDYQNAIKDALKIPDSQILLKSLALHALFERSSKQLDIKSLKDCSVNYFLSQSTLDLERNLASDLGLVGNLASERPLAIALSIPDRLLKSQDLKDVSKSYLSAGLLGSAEEIAIAIENPTLKSMALKEVCEARLLQITTLIYFYFVEKLIDKIPDEEIKDDVLMLCSKKALELKSSYHAERFCSRISDDRKKSEVAGFIEIACDNCKE